MRLSWRVAHRLCANVHLKRHIHTEIRPLRSVQSIPRPPPPTNFARQGYSFDRPAHVHATASFGSDAEFGGSTGHSNVDQDDPVVSVDRSGLQHVPQPLSGPAPKKSEETALVRHLKAVIQFRGGPISVAEYMEEVLTNPSCGYYMNRDVFGAEGDFVTSPDISQMFGELVGVWAMCLWQQMGSPPRVNLIELGPGRGTLMADLLRGTCKFRDFASAVEVHLVEVSPTLRGIQRDKLKVSASPSTSSCSGLSGAPVSWHLDLEDVPRGVPSILVAHEFFDALPVHQFQRTERGWCEKLLDVAHHESPHHLRFVLSPSLTTAGVVTLPIRLKKGRKTSRVEVCPAGRKFATEIARRVADDGGGALIIDYGEDGVIEESLQAIRNHAFVDVLEAPGTADLSVYVDFEAIKQAVEDAQVEATSFGPTTQSKLLGSLGINFRLESLLQSATGEEAEELQMGYWRLVGDGEAPWDIAGGKEVLSAQSQEMLKSSHSIEGMGVRYKALAIVNTKLGCPVGFN